MSHETGGQESSKNQDYNTEIAFSNINVSEPIPEVSKNQDYGTGIAFSNINVSEPIPESSKNQDYTTTPEPESMKLSQGNKRQKVGKKKPKVGYKKQRRGNKKEKLANKEQSVADRGSLKTEKNSFKIYPTEEIALESGRNLFFICLVFENFFAFGFPFDFWVNRRPNKKKQKPVKKKQKPVIKKQKRGNKGKV